MDINLALKRVGEAKSVASGIFSTARFSGYSHHWIVTQIQARVRNRESFKKLPGWAWARINEFITYQYELMYRVVLHHQEYMKLQDKFRRPEVVTYQHYEFWWPVVSDVWENLPPGIFIGNRTKCSYDELTRRFSVSRFEWAHNGRPYTNFTYNVHSDKTSSEAPTDDWLALMGLSNTAPWDPTWASSYAHAKSKVVHEGKVVIGYEFGDIPPVLALGFGIAAPTKYE